ncbi:MAG: hypothetical protein LAO76_21770 [Acidobacteriia bacterium]|nr:hypothetical protein [Terriglobia bacterium]
MNFYQANAFGLGGIFTRPLKDTLQSQAVVCLPSSGGHNFSSVENFSFHGLVSFRRAYAEVGGSFDECHNVYTSYSHSVIEGLNIADMVTADRVVCRVAAYSPQVDGLEGGEYSFSITGSYFEKLRIAGHAIDVRLATDVFHQYDTYSKANRAYKAGKADEWLPGSKLSNLNDSKLAELEDTYHALRGISERVREWKQRRNRQSDQDTYLFSPANHLKLEDDVGSKADLSSFGAIILVPKFGVVRLADLLVQRSNRQLIMLRVEMGSPMEGTITGNSSQAGGYLLSEGRSEKGRSVSHPIHPVKTSTVRCTPEVRQKIYPTDVIVNSEPLI